ncbi:hypothetical protein [Actinomadura xylanilytica]|uniref:hypothetical protein n=1 Tax=Actinomadura xylanilytica TaxID=887459 RepID=UPI00255AA57C|nr:hypothetical protein [Actinomadura xylanilytica]MDL4772978.1 hypothetical protein [Actinomadura xylanilytica]
MTPTSRIKEEFYLQRTVGDDAPMFVDATRYAREGVPYPLSAKRALKATCAVWTDDEVVAFSLRDYTAAQADREVEHLEHTVGTTTVTRSNVLRPRMPRTTLYELTEAARALSASLGDDVIVELDGDLYVLALTHRHDGAGLALVGRLAGTAGGGRARVGLADTEAEFKIPTSGVRLRVFLRSPVRRRVIAYAFSGYLAREPGELETLTRATALALNSAHELAVFRMLSGLDRFAVRPESGHFATAPSPSAGSAVFSVPVQLSSDDGTPAAEGDVVAEIDLERLDPVTGGLLIHLRDELTWNPAVVGSVRFETYRQVLDEAIGGLVDGSFGAEAVRDIAYDIALGDIGHAAVAGLRAATAGLPGLEATPARAEVRPRPPEAVRPPSCTDAETAGALRKL